MRWRAEVNKHLDVDSELVDDKFVKRHLPEIDLRCGGHQAPILGALYHPPGAIARHDAVAWAYARGADRQGAEIHQQTEVTDIDAPHGKVVGVQTSKGYVKTHKVLSAVAGWMLLTENRVAFRDLPSRMISGKSAMLRFMARKAMPISGFG